MSVGKFVCLFLSLMCFLCNPAYAEEFNCTAFAGCKALGYTVNAAECDEGFKVLCPLDTSKAFCKKKVPEAALPILYGDGTVTKKILADKTPVGVVFDEVNRLALALTDVDKNGSSGSEAMYWASTNSNVRDLQDCVYSDGDMAVDGCGADGRANTAVILGCSYCGTTYAANVASAYKPSGCTADFCKRKHQWFLPSIGELAKIYANKSVINASLNLLSGSGAKTLAESSYWSSTDYGQFSVWGFDMSDGGRYHYSKYGNGVRYVRPVVYYGEPKYGPPCEVGDVYYSDGTCIAVEYHTGDKTPVGIVAWLNDSNKNSGMLVSIQTTQLQWTTEKTNSSTTDISCLTNYTTAETAKTDMDGKKNTQCLMTYKSSYKFPAAEFCHTYKPANSGFGSSGWYLPALGEILKLKTNNNVNNDFKVARNGEKIGIQLNYFLTTNISGGTVHSSTEIYKKNSTTITCGVWKSSTQGIDTDVSWTWKDNINYVMCFHEF